MTNAQIADAFDELAELLAFQDANPFRVKAYRNAARTIRDYAESLAELADEGIEPLVKIKGIGKDLAEKIVTLANSGSLPMLEEERSKVPATVLAMMRVPGLGPKKAAALYKELHVTNLDELRKACEENKVKELKGFGAKTQELIIQGLDVADLAGQRIYWAEADTIVSELKTHLADCAGLERFEFAGSYRRGRETVGDLDVLAISTNHHLVMDRLETFPRIAKVIVRGETKMSIRLQSGLQVDLRVVPRESFGAALQYFTGSKDHNVIVRGMAKDRGLKINEYGVYRIEGDKETYIAGSSEEDVYATLELPVFPPEIREARKEFEWAKAKSIPDLIEMKDICGDLHMHTTETDGQATLLEMIAGARERGLSYIAITDHSKRVSMARGLDEKRLAKQWKEIDKVRKDLPDDFHVLKGIECDILEKGGMDLPDDILAEADWVLASIHYGQRQSLREITDRMLGAIEHPSVTAIAHPTGRILLRREAYAIDLSEIYRAAKKNGKILELNACPARLDLDDTQCATAKKHGIPIVINTDAHRVEELDQMRFGVLQARRAGLTRDDVVNAWDWPKFSKLLKSKP